MKASSELARLPELALRQRRQGLANQLPPVTETLRGSLVERYSRCCDACLERRVSVRKGGVKVEQVQYYHRAVACQIVSSPVKAVLAIEWLQSGESEDSAALRLLRKLPQVYGSRFSDILLLDALYAQEAVLQCAAQHGWELVISLKRNRPELYASAVRLFARRAPDLEFTETVRGKT